MRKAAIYARVSTERQAEKELSIPAQLQELKDYAANHNLEVVRVFADEGVSAKTDDRPEFQNMITQAKQKPRPFDVILFHKNDRFARNREDAIVYKSLLRRDCGIEIIAIKEDFGDGPVGQMIEGILEVIAEFYSLNLAQEVKKGMKEKAKKGKVLGETPLGYKNGTDGYLKIVPEEAEIVKYIFQEYTSTNKGLRAIARDLHLNGKMIFGAAGQKYKWSAEGIKVILTNETYAGTMTWNKRDATKNQKIRAKEDWIVVPNSHEPIIDKETFRMAQETLKSKRTQRSDSEDYLLRGMVICKDCGGSMTQYYEKWKRKDGTQMKKRKFRCSNYVHTGDCYFNHVGMEELEGILFSYLEDLLDGYIDIDSLNIIVNNKGQIEKKLMAKKRELSNIDNRFDRQMIAFENGVIDMAQLEKYKIRLEEEKNILQNEILDLEKQISQKNINTDYLKNRIYNAVNTIKDKNSSLQKRKEAIKSVVDHIEYSRARDEMAVHLLV